MRGKFMRGKKGEEGGGSAAVLVALIALMILVYLLFVPPDVRQNILGGDGISDSDDSDENVQARRGILLLENPGEVSEEGVSSFSHPMASLNLYLKKEGKVLERIGGVAIARSAFSETLRSVPFYIEDLGSTENIALSFNVLTGEGDLIVKLNGQEVFRRYVTGSVEPIVLSKAILKQANLLEFDVSSPGWKIWATNDYELTSMVVVGDVTDTSHKDGTAVFYMDADEKSDMRRGELYFQPYCSSDVDTLTVRLNGVSVFDGIPRCGYVNRYEIAPGQVTVGSNEVEFEINKGTYTITGVRFDTDLKKRKNPTYYFDVTDDQYYNITNRNYDAYLQLKFADDYKGKEGRVYVNNNIRSFDTDALQYRAKVTQFINEDYNSVRISPEGSFEITELKVWLKK